MFAMILDLGIDYHALNNITVTRRDFGLDE